nr:MAG TPA: hypothetical protein [Caudoviricetes sp.]
MYASLVRRRAADTGIFILLLCALYQDNYT